MAGQKVGKVCRGDVKRKAGVQLWHASMTSNLQKPVPDASHLDHLEATFVCRKAAYKVREGLKGDLEVVQMPEVGQIVGGKFFPVRVPIKTDDAEQRLRKEFNIEGDVASVELKWITTRYTASEPHYFFLFANGARHAIGAKTGTIVPE